MSSPSRQLSPVLFIQLSAMMFLQFFIWGAWYVTGPNYLSTIGFTADDFGWMYAVGPIAGMISPFFVGMIADRFFSAQKLLGVLHLGGGAVMFAATVLMKSATPSPDLINICFFAYMLTYFPTLALTNTLAMKNMQDPERQFPYIRVAGTIGWIAAGLGVSFLGFDTTVEMFYLAAGSALVLGVISFSLPDTPPTQTGPISARQILGLDALVLLTQPAYRVFLVASTLICIPLAFYYQIASRVVEMTGMRVGLTMSYGQMAEILFMLVMPFFFKRLGVKWMLAIGMLAWVIRYALFSMGAGDEIGWMIIGGIVLHGICYDFFFVTGQIYTDKAAAEPIRAQAQGLLVLFTLGLGMLIGAKVAAEIEAKYTPKESKAFAAQVKKLGEELAEATAANDTDRVKTLTAQKDQARHDELAAIDWQKLWGIPAAFAGVILLIFCFTFHERADRDPSPDPLDAVAGSGEMAPEDGWQTTPGDVDDG
jgi:nucleoside transporter